MTLRIGRWTGKRVRYDFDGDLAAELRIGSAPDFPHGSFAEYTVVRDSALEDCGTMVSKYHITALA